MTYAEVVAAAIGYAERSDADTLSNVDNFLRIVEARINRYLQAREQISTVTYNLVLGQYEYLLPTDFGGIRDIVFSLTGSRTDGDSLQLLSPEYFNTYRHANGSRPSYVIVDNYIRVWPIVEGNWLVVTYYTSLAPLTSSNTSNWVSIKHPDAYVFGLLTEISAFVKDQDAMALWDARFKQALGETIITDWNTRWSGPPLVVKSMS